ncbi:MAG TPA: hypothetical protein VGH72_33620 [Pseudonocardia sp.]|jgi:hypothetical protein
MRRYEVRQDGGKFQVFDLGTRKTQVGGVSKSKAQKLCEQANKMGDPLKSAPPGLPQPKSGPVQATARRLPARKAIGR